MNLPWVGIFQRRCKAYLPPVREHSYEGRCELRADHEPELHALQRGGHVPRWSTRLRS